MSPTKRSAFTIPLESLAAAWSLKPEDLGFVREGRGDAHRLRCALQLCALRRQGCFLPRPGEVPPQILVYLADQLGLKGLPDLDDAWPATESHQLDRIRRHLGFLNWGPEAETDLRSFLVARFKVDFYSEEMREVAEEFLFQRKVVRPASSTLKRLCASVARTIQDGMFEAIAGQLTLDQIHALEAMLQVAPGHSVSPLQELKAFPPEAGPEVLWEYLDRWKNLDRQNFARIELTQFSPSLIKTMAGTARGHDAHTLRRVEPKAKRLALLACFLSEASSNLLDHIVDLNSQWLAGHQRRTKHNAEARVAKARAQHWASLHAAYQALKRLLEASGASSIESFVQEEGLERLTQIVHGCEELEQSGSIQDLVELARGYSVLRRYAPAFYRLPFEAESRGEPILDAIHLLRRLDENGISELPEDTPCEFLKGAWTKQVRDEQGKLIRKRWEMGVMFVADEALRSGLLFLSGSRAYRSPTDRLLPDAVWNEAQVNAAAELGLPTTFGEALAGLQADFTHSAKLAVEALEKGDYVYRLPNGKVKLRREKAVPEPESVTILRQRIEDRMKPIRIEQVLMEADAFTGFLEAFQSPSGLRVRQTFPREGLMAALIAGGTNLGFLEMSRCTEDITYDRLQRVAENYIRPETLRDASRRLVNAHNRMPITRTWGDGTFSSSDGQRFVIRRGSVLGAVYPRYAGYYQRMVNVYTHTSDTDAVLATQVISCAEREAPYVIDGFYQNTSEIQPTFHTTDTHGYTERVFGLCHLLGFFFCPRIKNLKKAQLYRMYKNHGFPELDPIFSGTIDLALIQKHWDDLLRLALSIKRGVSTAQSLMRTLSGPMESHPISKAMTAFGQLIKTIFILRYFGDSELRRDVQRQLNRGEERHQLAKHIRFAHRGDFRTGNLLAVLNQATALSLLSNAVLLSNTRQIERIVQELEAEGFPVDLADLARISPISFKNVIPHGTYRFHELLKEVA